MAKALTEILGLYWVQFYFSSHFHLFIYYRFSSKD